MRVDHYIKNIVIFIPLILTIEPATKINLIQTLFLFISFCLISSTVYILNDLKDKEQDAANPHKKSRPIAKGLISTKQALLMITTCFAISLLISIYLNSYFFILLYLFLNMAYSYYLKKIFISNIY